MIEFFLSRRVLTNLITLFVVFVGGWHFVTVRREAFPDFTFDIVTIQTAYPGASPEEVQSLVTKKIEDELRGITGLDKVESFSIENRSLVVLRLDEDLSDREVSRAVDDVRQAVSRVRELPERADKPLVTEMTSARPLITMSLAGGTDEARDHFADEMKDVIEEISGVSKVELEGDREREIWIEADRDKLERSRVTLGEIAESVRRRNVDASAGAVEMGGPEVWVRAVGKIETATDVSKIIVRGNDARSYIRVADLAKVTERFEDKRLISRAGGADAIHLKVSKLKSGDTIKLADAVRKAAAVAEPRARALGIRLVLSDDWSFFIKRRLKVMTNNLLQGGVLILGALFLFLDWRLAVVAAWGVPISFAAAMLFAQPFGLTINLLSLIAFIIVLGMLDDDSVVVAENIYRHLEMGKPPEQAAVDGAKEVAMPVIGSVLVSCCAFLPFAIMEGIMGKFMAQVPLVVVLAFIASVFEAFFILPSHVIDLIPLGKPVSESADSRWYLSVVDLYRRTVNWVLHHRAKFGLLTGAFLLATVGVAWLRLKVVMFPPGLIDQFFIQVEMPRGTGLTNTRRAFEEVEKAVMALPSTELEALTGTIGMLGYEETVRLGTNLAQARVFLTPEETRPRKTKEIEAALRERLKAVPGAERVIFEEMKAGPPTGKAVMIRIRGRDPKLLVEIAGRIKRELGAMPGVVDIKDSEEGGKDQLRLVLDAPEASFAGMDVARASQDLALAVDGGEVTKIRRPDEEVVVKVRLQESQRSKASDLMALEVLNPQGRPVRLSRIGRFEKAQGPPFLQHYNFRPVVTVTADVNLAKTTSHEVNSAIQNRFKDLSKEFPGYELIFGGEEEQTRKSMRSLFRAFGIAVLLDFVILATLFRSYLQPFIILLTIPIGLLGVVYALILHNMPASFMALMGVVAMPGVVVNNAIVLVNFINVNREAGMDARQAAAEAGAQRFRPIWASSITTLLGLFPTAYGFGGYEPFVAPMALSLAWGLTIAMPLTLFLIPMAYVLADDLTSWIKRKK